MRHGQILYERRSGAVIAVGSSSASIECRIFPERRLFKSAKPHLHHRSVHRYALIICLIAAIPTIAFDRQGDWTGDYERCNRHRELLKRESMDIGVRFSTTNSTLAEQFAYALSFWATIVDMKWHRVEDTTCALQILDGDADLFRSAVVARAQFPRASSFQGWIAFNPAISMSAPELFVTAVHEFGHVLGLPHNADPSSVMYFLRTQGPVVLDEDDLSALARHHKLRSTIIRPVLVPEPVATQSKRLRDQASRNIERVSGLPDELR
jgi:hypothetical protein